MTWGRDPGEAWSEMVARVRREGHAAGSAATDMTRAIDTAEQARRLLGVERHKSRELTREVLRLRRLVARQMGQAVGL